MIDRKVEIIDDKIISANWFITFLCYIFRKLTETHIYTIRTYKIGKNSKQIEESFVDRRFPSIFFVYKIYLDLVILNDFTIF